MKVSQIGYEKDNNIVYISDKFIYLEELYLIWSWGASSLGEKYYSSSKPISLKLKNKKLKRKDYLIYRFLTLKFAPEEFLVKNGYKLIENEN